MDMFPADITAGDTPKDVLPSKGNDLSDNSVEPELTYFQLLY